MGIMIWQHPVQTAGAFLPYHSNQSIAIEISSHAAACCFYSGLSICMRKMQQPTAAVINKPHKTKAFHFSTWMNQLDAFPGTDAVGKNRLQKGPCVPCLHAKKTIGQVAP